MKLTNKEIARILNLLDNETKWEYDREVLKIIFEKDNDIRIVRMCENQFEVLTMKDNLKFRWDNLQTLDVLIETYIKGE